MIIYKALPLMTVNTKYYIFMYIEKLSIFNDYFARTLLISLAHM